MGCMEVHSVVKLTCDLQYCTCCAWACEWACECVCEWMFSERGNAYAFPARHQLMLIAEMELPWFSLSVSETIGRA